MGQAKNRGSREQRIQAAQERKAALRPTALTCNDCGAAITDFDELDTQGLRGMEAAYAGICPGCGAVTHALKGDPEIVTAFAEFLEQEHGELNIGVQSKDGQRVA